MGDLTIKGIDERILEALHRQAAESDVDLSMIVQRILAASILPALEPPIDELDIFTEEERKRRAVAIEEAAALRARTLKPFASDSTLVIREGRDRGWR